MKFTEKDIQQITDKGLTLDKVEAQIELFKTGVPFVNLTSAATINNGIVKCSEEEKAHYINYFETKGKAASISKFVPASGAATRMFKNLFKFIDEYSPEKESLNAYINRNKDTELSLFFMGMEKLPFYDKVIEQIEQYYPEYHSFSSDKQQFTFVKTMLGPKNTSSSQITPS